MIPISSKYAIGFDKLNTILMEKYEKREGKGKHAPLSGEFGWRDIGYYSTLKSLVGCMVEKELRILDEEKATLDEAVERIEDLKADILEILINNKQIQEGMIK